MSTLTEQRIREAGTHTEADDIDVLARKIRDVRALAAQAHAEGVYGVAESIACVSVVGWLASAMQRRAERRKQEAHP